MLKFTLNVELTDEEIRMLRLFNLTGRRSIDSDTLEVFEKIRLKLRQAMDECNADGHMNDYIEHQKDIDAGIEPKE